MTCKLSIVTTLYRSRETIEEFIQRAIAAAEAVTDDIEVVIVNDGSPDDSAAIVRKSVDADPRISLVELSRNFGHHHAMLAGLDHARGDLVFLIDSDLEEPPELLPEMADVLREKSVDCVYGLQQKRRGGYVERMSGRLFYWLFRTLSDVGIPENVSTMRLMTRRYVDSLLRFRDKNPVFVPLSILTGYPQAPFEFVKSSTSETTYSIGRRIALMLLAITTFSARPLMLMLLFSLLMAALGILYGSYVVLSALTGPVQDGWSSLMAVVVFFFSLNAVFTGLIGLYVKQILEEVKDRPRSIVQEIYSHKKTSESSRVLSTD
ncbi:glycosyltransferase family 2 protein [Rhizobium sp. ZK1]|uniref:glycosyltransferase family 2 protein n=1 Tax=Rhizobium sp. ZK1 TaxID=3389872 RepID=UPI0039F6DD57